jgi:hypothetical protein
MLTWIQVESALWTSGRLFIVGVAGSHILLEILRILPFSGGDLAALAAGLSGNCESGKCSLLIRIRKISVVH